ncbi:MAG TPA: hypothetical protein VG796_06370 [Verrucomicrobiales bacterium]|nr:hypothetical protein [Verrucomicrobiales bacterium]
MNFLFFEFVKLSGIYFCAIAGVICLALSKAVFAGEKDSFEAMYADARRSYGVDMRQSAKWLTWDGLSTIQGLDLIVDELTMEEDRGRRRFSNFMLDNMRLDRSAIANRIMERTTAIEGEPSKLQIRLVILDRYGDEPGVVRFWAKYLSDTRSAETKPRNPESLSGQTIRVCDVADGCLRRWLEKKKLWMPGDPGYGDAGGETTWEARNRGIDALNEVLLKNKLITIAVRPDPHAVTPLPPTAPRQVPEAINSMPGRRVTEPGSIVPKGPPSSETGESWWWLWLPAVIISGSVLVWVLLKRRA